MHPVEARKIVEDHRARSCVGKERYGGKRGATRAVQDMLEKGKGKGSAQFVAYKCLYCHGWHVGHKSRSSDHRARLRQAFVVLREEVDGG